LSASNALLIFLDPHSEFEGWLLLRGRDVAGRGTGLEGLPPLVDPDSNRPIGVVAVVPGEAVTLHWLEVPAGLAPAQAAAAARLMASEVSAQPLTDMHVAVGPEGEGSALRAVAIAPALGMAGWIGKLQAEGLDPDVIIPEPLLLPPPTEGFVRYDRGELPIYRGANEAFSLEPALAGLITAEAPVETIGHEAYESGLFAAVARPAVNLRQGAFAKRRRWKIEWKLVRRLALLLLATLVVTLAIQIVSIWRYTYAADALEMEANRIAGRALGSDAANAPEALERRLTDLRGSGAGYASLASAMFGAIRATPNAELSAFAYERDGTMRTTVMADSPATLATLEQRVEASGFDAELGALRSGGGRPTADLTVRAR
jgi:general secretion pathway protein L